MAAPVSFGRPSVRSICSIFPLCMESNTVEKLTNNIVASKFFACTCSRIRRIVKICYVVDLFLQKAILVLPKYFLNFWFYAVL